MNPRIILVAPPLSEEIQSGSFKAIANILPSLGLGYIAAVLENKGFEVKVIDSRPLHLSLEALNRILKNEKPDIIGITATVLEIEGAARCAETAKKEIPNALLVIGGAHLTSLPEETLQKSPFDIGVIGEGEFTMLEIAEQVRSGRLDPEKVKGIIYRKNGKLAMTPPRGHIQDLDSLPFPARHLLPPLDKYRPVIGSYIKWPFGHLISSRGCPHQCIFCDRKVFGNGFRARSPENIVDEIEILINRYGAREIKFFDDTFTLDKDRIYGLATELKKRNIKIPWSCLTRANYVDKPLLHAMKKAGCLQIHYGLESGDQRILDIMKKGLTLQQNENAVIWTKEAGLSARASFVFGIPGETMESIGRTIEFAKRLPLDIVNFYAATLYPGNELYEMAKRDGTMLHEDYSQYSPSIDVHKTRLAYVAEGLTEEQLRTAISRAHKEFYFRPEYIVRQILAIRGWSDIASYWTAFKVLMGL